MGWLSGWLDELAARRSPEELAEYLLWPRTPIGDEIQDRIRERVGVSDHEADDRRSRPARIVELVARLIRSGRMGSDEGTVLDIACGDALILSEVAERTSSLDCHGVDLNIGAFPAHERAQRVGVGLHRVLIQDLFAATPPAPIDVVLMLNTYRGWANADLPERDRDLPRAADTWLRAHARHVVVTATPPQLAAWRAEGWAVADLGPGEERSRLVCIARERRPAGWRAAGHAARERLLAAVRGNS